MRDQVLGGSRKMKESWLFGLLTQCPSKGGNPKDCPLYERRAIRKMSEWTMWIQGLSDLELGQALCNHFDCKNNPLH